MDSKKRPYEVKSVSRLEAQAAIREIVTELKSRALAGNAQALDTLLRIASGRRLSAENISMEV